MFSQKFVKNSKTQIQPFSFTNYQHLIPKYSDLLLLLMQQNQI